MLKIFHIFFPKKVYANTLYHWTSKEYIITDEIIDYKFIEPIDKNPDNHRYCIINKRYGSITFYYVDMLVYNRNKKLNILL